MEIHIQRKAIHLQDILIEKTIAYLRHDNPKSPNSVTYFYNLLFTGHGSVGRERAQAYLKNIIHRYTDEELLKEVYFDVIGKKNRLGSSRLYKLRLLEGICDYLNIHEKAETSAQNFYSFLSTGANYNSPIPSFNEVRLKILTQHITTIVQQIISLQRFNQLMFPL